MRKTPWSDSQLDMGSRFAIPSYCLFDYILGRLVGACKSLVLVICPLISLIVDQVVSLRAKDVNAAVISTAGGDVIGHFVASEHDLEVFSLLFCAPEALIGCRWREALQTPAISERIVADTIDEVQCLQMISGHFNSLLHTSLIQPCK